MGFFDESDDDDIAPAPAAPPAPAPAAPPAPAPAAPPTAPTVPASRDPPVDPLNLRRVPVDRLTEQPATSARSTLPPASTAAPPKPPPSVPREPLRKPFDEEGEAAEEVDRPRSSGAGSSHAPLSIAEIMANFEANTSIVRMEAVEKGKAPMRSAAKVAPPRVGTADRAKRPRPTVTSFEDLEEGLEKEALAHGSGEEDEDDDEAEATEAIEQEEDDGILEWPRFDGDGWGPKEPHPLGPRPDHVEGSIYPAEAFIPASVNKHLRPYQREGVEWMWNQYARGRGGLLGDDMGLGKTVQTIAFLTAVLGKLANSEDRERRFPLPSDDRRQALVVVPTSTLTNWERELRTWGSFRWLRCHGDTRESALEQAKEGGCEVLLTTYGMLLKNARAVGEVKWTVAFFDEVHTLKNPKGKSNLAAFEALERCQPRFGLSGTPMSNKYVELWSLFDFVSNHRVGTQKDFRSFYVNSLQAGFKLNASQWEINQRMRRQKQIKELIDMWMLQRFKDETIQDQMPKKEDNIVFCKLAPEQQEVYERILESPDYQMIRSADDPCHCGSGEKTKHCHNHNPEGILFRWSKAHPDGEPCEKCPTCIGLPATTQLLKVGNHLSLLRPDPLRMKPGTDEYEKQTEFARMAFGLEHGPKVNMDRELGLLDNMVSETKCGKMRAVVALLRTFKAKKQKVLLFSYSTQMLDILEAMVLGKGYIYLRLDGSTPAAKRGKLVDDFNTIDEKFIFLLSTKAGGLGLNLVSATAVLVFDPNWNPSCDMQAQDRAYRIGQRHDVKVYRLIASNTVEEKIYQRQLYKQGQEGLALRQRDENRYFEGVMDDPHNKGELFGYKNLFSYDEEKAGGAHAEGSTTRALLARGRKLNENGEETEEPCYYVEKDLTRAAVGAEPQGASHGA
eukprot:CAMPEP_0118825914 /NCGR_PEP_ID=MMETSP1162-20130426/11609_1 /TAXON_ID=33656 /ORGANISM="Phaeocystis Sp, Strain CCMP2710" /LENGTH=899 /DNA_ID=CAMNT_0006756611 /DNA_START=21 /DNA_END=2716 /DNA_ORIENTATION=-